MRGNVLHRLRYAFKELCLIFSLFALNEPYDFFLLLFERNSGESCKGGICFRDVCSQMADGEHSVVG